MKTLTIYFLKRWWWVYLSVFVIDFLLAAESNAAEAQVARVAFSSICVFVFSSYLQRGGGGAFWLPITRRKISRVYWAFMLVMPALIFGASELLVRLLDSDALLRAIFLSLKHFVFFLGFASAFLISRKTLVLAPLLFVNYEPRENFFRYMNLPIQIIFFLLCIASIRTTFVRSEHLVSKTLFAAEPRTRFTIWKRFFHFSWRSKQTGMRWILETIFWSVIKIYIFIFAILLLLPLLPDFFPEDFVSMIPFILFCGLFASTNPAGLLVSNLRTSRALPLTIDQLATWLVGLTFGTGVFVCLLLVPLFPFVKFPHWTFLIALAILEGILLLQTIAIFIGATGLRGAGAIISAVLIAVLIFMVFNWLKLFTEFRIALSILVSLPLAFLIQRECLRRSSALYRPTKESALEV